MTAICFICLRRGWNKGGGGGGICIECNSWVCRMPSSRPDNVVHGYDCGCSCDKLVCELHVIKHSSSHGSSGVPPSCFPELTLAVAPLAGSAAADLAAGVNTSAAAEEERYQMVGRLLRLVAPGHEALYEEMTPPGSFFETEPATDDPPQRELQRSFYTDARLAKIVALAARTIGETFLEAGHYSYEIQTACRALCGETETDDLRSAVDHALEPWLREGVEVPDPLLIPMTSPKKLAQWLLRDSETSAPVEPEGSTSLKYASYAQLYSQSQS